MLEKNSAEINTAWQAAKDQLTKNNQSILQQLDNLVADKITSNDYNEIADYIKSDNFHQYLFKELALPIHKHGNTSVVAVSKKIGLPRTFSIEYNYQTKQFTINIHLKSKITSEIVEDNTGLPGNAKEKAKQGTFNKYTKLFTLNLDPEKINVLITGQLVEKIEKNLDKKALEQRNEIVKAKVNLQNALAELGIAIPVSVLLPAFDSSGKVSIKTIHGVPLSDFKDNLELWKIYQQQILEKFAKLANMGIIHGDIKPDNILICQNSQGVNEAYIADLDTLGFVGDLHRRMSTPGYTLATEHIISADCKDSHVLPTELMKVFCYNAASDLCAITTSLKQVNRQLAPLDLDPIIAQSNAALRKYHNNQFYANLPDVDYQKNLASLYQEIFQLPLKVEIAEEKSAKIKEALLAFRHLDPIVEDHHVKYMVGILRNNTPTMLANIKTIYDKLPEVIKPKTAFLDVDFAQDNSKSIFEKIEKNNWSQLLSDEKKAHALWLQTNPRAPEIQDYHNAIVVKVQLASLFFMHAKIGRDEQQIIEQISEYQHVLSEQLTDISAKINENLMFATALEQLVVLDKKISMNLAGLTIESALKYFSEYARIGEAFDNLSPDYMRDPKNLQQAGVLLANIAEHLQVLQAVKKVLNVSDYNRAARNIYWQLYDLQEHLQNLQNAFASNKALPAKLENMQTQEKKWQEALAEIKGVELTDEMQRRLGRDNLHNIIDFLSEQDLASILSKSKQEKFSMFFDKNDFIRNEKLKLSRSFTLHYDAASGEFSLDINLKSKIAVQVNNEPLKDKNTVAAGADNKYTKLLNIEWKPESPVEISLDDYGQLVPMLDQKVADRAGMIETINELTESKVVLQNALANLRICLPCDILPPGSKGLKSIKSIHAMPLLDFNGDPNMLTLFYQQIAGKLAKLHAMGIVHGDIKPDNIFIYNGEAFLSDIDTLGFNKEMHVYQGTADYMLPMQLLSGIDHKLVPEILPTEVSKAMCYSPSNDMYALAVSMREMNQIADLKFIKGESATLAPVYDHLAKYLNPQAPIYTTISDNMAQSDGSVSLVKFYEEIFGQPLEQSVLDTTVAGRELVSESLSQMLSVKKQLRTYQPRGYIPLLKKAGLENLHTSMQNLYANYSANCLKESILFPNLAEVLPKLKDHALNYDNLDNFTKSYKELNQSIENINSLLTVQLLAQLSDIKITTDKTLLTSYKDQIFVALQMVNLVALQAQRYNTLIDKFSKKNQSVKHNQIALGSLRETEAALENVYASIELLLAKKHVKTFTPSAHNIELAPTALQQLDKICASMTASDKSLPKDFSVEQAQDYAVTLLLHGESALNIQCALFNQLSSKDMADIYKKIHKHYNVILAVEHRLLTDPKQQKLHEEIESLAYKLGIQLQMLHDLCTMRLAAEKNLGNTSAQVKN